METTAYRSDYGYLSHHQPVQALLRRLAEKGEKIQPVLRAIDQAPRPAVTGRGLAHAMHPGKGAGCSGKAGSPLPNEAAYRMLLVSSGKTFFRRAKVSG